MIKLSRRAAFAAVLSVLLLAASCQAGFLFDIWDELLTPFLDVSPSAAVLTAGQHLTLTAIGGRGPYMFSQTGGAGTLTDNHDGTAEYLADGGATTASILLSDSRGDEVLVDIMVSAAPIPQLYILPSSASLVYGGTLDFEASGGQGTYFFSIASGAGSIVEATGVYTAPPALDTDAVVQVEDSSGQAAQAVVTVRSAATASLAIVPTSVVMEVLTNYTFSASGGTTPYVFEADGVPIPTNPDGLTVDFTAPADPAVVTVTVTDATLATADATVTVVAASGSVLTIVPSSINVSFGSTFQFTSDGGVPPYSYAMGTTYGGTVTSAGLYTAPTDRQGVETVIVTDGRGVMDTATVKVKKK